jgi:hypothetical protein
MPTYTFNNQTAEYLYVRAYNPATYTWGRIGKLDPYLDALSVQPNSRQNYIRHDREVTFKVNLLAKAEVKTNVTYSKKDRDDDNRWINKAIMVVVDFDDTGTKLSVGG